MDPNLNSERGCSYHGLVAEAVKAVRGQKQQSTVLWSTKVVYSDFEPSICQYPVHCGRHALAMWTLQPFTGALAASSAGEHQLLPHSTLSNPL